MAIRVNGIVSADQVEGRLHSAVCVVVWRARIRERARRWIAAVFKRQAGSTKHASVVTLLLLAFDSSGGDRAIVDLSTVGRMVVCCQRIIGIVVGSVDCLVLSHENHTIAFVNELTTDEELVSYAVFDVDLVLE